MRLPETYKDRHFPLIKAIHCTAVWISKTAATCAPPVMNPSPLALSLNRDHPDRLAGASGSLLLDRPVIKS